MAKKKKKKGLPLKKYVLVFFSLCGGMFLFWSYQWVTGATSIPVIEPQCIPTRKRLATPQEKNPTPSCTIYDKIAGQRSTATEKLLPSSTEEVLDVSHSIDDIIQKTHVLYQIGPIHPSMAAAKVYWKTLYKLFSMPIEAKAGRVPSKKGFRIVIQSAQGPLLEKILREKNIPFQKLP